MAKIRMGPVLANNAFAVRLQGNEMGLDDPFPIEKCSGRVRSAVLSEFQGRCPTIREVASIPDAHWLTVPNIGPTTLGEIRRFIGAAPMKERSQDLPEMKDGELLSRLNRVQRELSLISNAIRTRLSSSSEKIIK